jgi:hypothetical protein
MILLTLLTICSISYAEEIGRYQAVVISKGIEQGKDSVFIIDTKEGHIWVWDEYRTIGKINVGGGHLTYMGKVKPAQKIDEKETDEKITEQRYKIPDK